MAVHERIAERRTTIAERAALIARLRGLARDASRLEAAIARLEDDEARSELVLDARAALDTRGLRDVLYELESGAPMLMVENLTVIARRAQRRRTRTVTRPLDVRFRLVGFMRARPSAEGETP